MPVASASSVAPAPTSTPTSTLPSALTAVLLPVSSLAPREGNRNLAKDTHISALAATIEAVGLLSPIRVRALDGDLYEIVAGVRRWMAYQLLQRDTIPAFIDAAEGAPDADCVRFVENHQRKTPSAIDMGRALQRVKRLNAYTNAQVAAYTGIGVSLVNQYLALMLGSDFILDVVEKHELPLGIARVLVRCEKLCGLAATKRLLAKCPADQLLIRDVDAVLARHAARAADKSPKRTSNPSPGARNTWRRSLASAYQRDPELTCKEVAAFLEELRSQAPSGKPRRAKGRAPAAAGPKAPS